jgi:excisionase family DNA binding protein
VLELFTVITLERIKKYMDTLSSVFTSVPSDPLLLEVDRILGAEMPQLIDRFGTITAVPPVVYQALRCLVGIMVAGQSVAIVPQTKYLSCQQAADLLGCSRPHLYSLLDQGVLPCIKVGRHRRLQMTDVMTYKLGRSSEQHQALMELAALSKKLGLI